MTDLTKIIDKHHRIRELEKQMKDIIEIKGDYNLLKQEERERQLAKKQEEYKILAGHEYRYGKGGGSPL